MARREIKGLRIVPIAAVIETFQRHLVRLEDFPRLSRNRQNEPHKPYKAIRQAIYKTIDDIFMTVL